MINDKKIKQLMKIN